MAIIEKAPRVAERIQHNSESRITCDLCKAVQAEPLQAETREKYPELTTCGFYARYVSPGGTVYGVCRACYINGTQDSDPAPVPLAELFK
jgi:hypothetical protein